MRLKPKIGDKVKLRDDCLQRHSRSVPPNMGYSPSQFKWRKTLNELLGEIGTITLTFDNSKHVNVQFANELIGIDFSELDLIS